VIVIFKLVWFSLAIMISMELKTVGSELMTLNLSIAMRTVV
jgi:hypothetical protein